MSKYTLTVKHMDGAYIHRPEGEMFPLVQAADELNALLARAEAAEAALANRDVVLSQMQAALRATYAETQHPDIGAAERKPMMPHERIEWLGKDRDHWESRAKAAEEKLRRFLTIPSCSPEIVVPALTAPAPVATKVETISFAQVKMSEIPASSVLVPPDWQRVRIDAAIAAMQGILSGRGFSAFLATTVSPETKAAELASDYADALVAKLKKEVAG